MSDIPTQLEQPSDRELIFIRHFAAPVERVWAAWTDPDQVVQWWGPKGFTTTTHAMDVRAGGKWRYTMHGPDGHDFPNVMTYHEVKQPSRLVYDHGDEKNPKWFHVAVDFKPDNGGTQLVTRMTFDNPQDCEQTKKYGIDGHSSTMARLEKQLADFQPEREIVISRVFVAPRELVWQAMTDPKHIAHWWGPRGFRTETERFDFREGGVWQHVMIGPDGAKYPNKTIFKEIVPQERIVYSNGGGREEGPGANFIATWLFEPSGKKNTRLTIRMTFPSSDMRDRVVREFGAIEGGRQTLTRLSEFLPSVQGEPFVITREFAASRDLVWKTWTEVEHLREWWGPAGFRVTKATVDLRPQGLFHYCMLMPDGGTMWGRAAYREIVPPEKLVWINSFSDPEGGITSHPLTKDPWPLQILTTVTFAEHAGKTTVTIEQLPYEASEAEWKVFTGGRESMKMGWGGLLEKYKAHLAKP